MSLKSSLAERLPSDAISTYSRLRLGGVGRKRAIETVEKMFPDLSEVENFAWENFERSKRGMELMKKIEEGASTDDLERYGLLSKKATRIGALCDMTVRLIDRFDTEMSREKPNITNVTRINREVRTNLGAIRDEVQGLGLDSEPVLSQLERVTQALETLSAGRRKELIGDLKAGPWAQQQQRQ